MPDKKDQGAGFRVVDRRSFGADGTRREVSEQGEKKQETLPSPPPTSAARAEPETEERFEEAATGFDTLVSYLSTTALFQLGLLPGPRGERIPPDMVNAQRTIELLEVLQEKTQGNLAAEEARLLDDVLYELRLSFVEVQKRQAPRSK